MNFQQWYEDQDKRFKNSRYNKHGLQDAWNKSRVNIAPPTDDQLRTLWALTEDFTGETTVGQRMRRAWDYVAEQIQKDGA